MLEVYKITNLKNGKIYIGITNQGANTTRWYKHCSDANVGSCFPLHNAIRKYGKENFQINVIEIMDGFDYDQLKEREVYWIKHYDSYNREKGYNLTLGGDGTFGRFHSEETKDKIRQKAIGRKVSNAAKQKMSESQKNVKRNYSELAKLSNKKRWSNIEYRKRASINNHKNKKVLQYTLNLEFIKEYINVADAGRSITKPPQNIASCARGRLKTAYGFIWKYKEDKELTV